MPTAIGTRAPVHTWLALWTFSTGKARELSVAQPLMPVSTASAAPDNINFEITLTLGSFLSIHLGAPSRCTFALP
ncbi:NADPH:quinone reductase [Pseudomonas sp. Os17]|nr:NADPH:quinone reductase [Pseudomonas sp. Os17]